jgi:sugar lactone lactonase YvrE
MAEPLRVVSSGHACTEAPRWHEGDLYFSDMHGRAVHVVSDGASRKLVDVPGTPGGLGFLPDGTLLVVVQDQRAVYQLRDGDLVLHADLSSSVTSNVNDLLVLPSGRAYVGEMGFDVHAFLAAAAEGREDGPAFVPARLLVIDPDGSHRAATGATLLFPNGIALAPTGELLVAESFGFRISALELAEDGTVAGSRLWAQLEFAPDGISVTPEGHLWVADPDGRRAALVAEGGEVLAEVATEDKCLSVAFEGTQLALCTTVETDPHRSTARPGSKVLVATSA